MTRTNDQKRAAYALEFVRKEKGKDGQDKLLTHIRKAPIQILQNGLGQTLAFLLADNEGKAKPSGRLYGQLQDWLCGSAPSKERPCRIYRQEEPDLIDQLMAGDRDQYMLAERESVALLNWMKKFAEAWLT